jgi:L-ornithine N5-oxygenase
MYEDDLDGRHRVSLRTNRLITAAEVADGQVRLHTTEHITGAPDEIVADRVILATGYLDLGTSGRTEQLPPLLRDLAGVLRADAELGLSVGLDYRAEPAAGYDVPPVYINGLCETTHGLGDAGSFSLLALRSQAIVQSLRHALTGAGEADLVGAGPSRGPEF